MAMLPPPPRLPGGSVAPRFGDDLVRGTNDDAQLSKMCESPLRNVLLRVWLLAQQGFCCSLHILQHAAPPLGATADRMPSPN